MIKRGFGTESNFSIYITKTLNSRIQTFYETGKHLQITENVLIDLAVCFL